MSPTSAASDSARSRPPPRTSSPSRCPPRRSRSSATSNCNATSPTCGCAAPGCRCSSAWTCGPRSAPTTSAGIDCTRSSTQYGADTVKAVMKRMMNDAEHRLRGKLAGLPDGTWKATGYQDQSHEGDRGLHKITVTTTKTDDHLTFDFTGTDPQAGVINCTYAGMRGGVMLALLPILAGDIPWSAGGLMRCFDLVTEEGTLNNATYPAAVGRGPIGPAWLTGSLVAECLSQMLDRDLELGKNVQATCCGTWDTAVIAGLDERARAARAVPQHRHGADGRRIRSPPPRRRDGHRRPVLHPDGTHPRCRDDRVPLPHPGPVAARGARLRRPRPPPWRGQRIRGDHRRTEPASRWPSSWPPRARPSARTSGLSGGHPGNTGHDVIARDSRVTETARRRTHAQRAVRDQRHARTHARTTRRATWPPARS